MDVRTRQGASRRSGDETAQRNRERKAVNFGIDVCEADG